MTRKIAPRILRGTRDFLPQTMLLRQHVMGVLRHTFERFGFEPLETPAIELAQTLEGKYGPEGDRLVYRFDDRGGRPVGLRYDLTVPLARVVAMHPRLPKPFKRYQMQPVWRADKPRKGRYREFWQCDCDIVGSASMLADAEIIALIATVLPKLGLTDLTIRLNSRKLLAGLVQYAGVPEAQAVAVFRAIDKQDKIGREGVKRELLGRAPASESDETGGDDGPSETAGDGERELFVSEAAADRVLDLIELRGDGTDVLARLGEQMADIPIAVAGIGELAEVVGYLGAMDVPPTAYQVDLSLARGLDYYTGPIFEAEVQQLVGGRPIGSVAGGGRYDELVGMFTAQSVPATGTSLGVERIIDVLEELQGSEDGASHSITAVLVTVYDQELVGDSLAVVRDLRQVGISTEVSLDPTRGLRAQVRYADRRGIPWAVFLGPDERAAGTVTVRDLATGEQTTLPRAAVVAFLEGKVAPISPSPPVEVGPGGEARDNSEA